jgi:hypothetical protein
VDAEDVRLAVYRTFAGTGRAPDAGQLAEHLGAGLPAVTVGLDELPSARHLVLGDWGQIVMAHPFSAVPLGFSITGTRTLCWAGCAWDSFALLICFPARANCWWRPPARRAGARTPGTPDRTGRRMAARALPGGCDPDRRRTGLCAVIPEASSGS